MILARILLTTTVAALAAQEEAQRAAERVAPAAPTRTAEARKAEAAPAKDPAWWTELRARIALLGAADSAGAPVDPRIGKDGSLVVEGAVESPERLEAIAEAVKQAAPDRPVRLDVEVVPVLAGIRKILRWSDEALERKLQGRIDADPRLAKLGIVVADVQGGRVTLAGTVPDAEERLHAEEIVAGAAEVREIENHIDVVAPGAFARRGRRALSPH